MLLDVRGVGHVSLPEVVVRCIGDVFKRLDFVKFVEVYRDLAVGYIPIAALLRGTCSAFNVV